jgi:hypothetical protein
MTRQRRWQIKMAREGKCRICGAAAATKSLCEKHRLAANTRGREAAHRRDSAKRRYAGAEYAHGHHATTIFHFPKWLLAKRFVLEYYPRTGNFYCKLLNRDNAPIGFGKSVTQAAKRSLHATKKVDSRCAGARMRASARENTSIRSYFIPDRPRKYRHC